jgi:hypothetical protein
MNQVARNVELLDTARDCFHFVTEFFEPINTSATHIYHSALELSPLSSIVRRLYYHQWHTPSPRVVVGSWDSWDQGIAIEGTCGKGGYQSYTWSPCGRFVATHAGTSGEIVEIRDGLTLELLSTLTKPDENSPASLSGTSLSTSTTPDSYTGGLIYPPHSIYYIIPPVVESTYSPGHFTIGGFTYSLNPYPLISTHPLGNFPIYFPDTPPTSTFFIGGPAYSPDGHSLASLSKASLIIWDIQTGGVTKEIEHSAAEDISLVWSLDGRTIGTISHDKGSKIWTVHTCDITSGTTQSFTTLQSTDDPHLWAHNTSFCVMTTGWDGQAPTINIFEVGSALTKLESFTINLCTTTEWVRASHQDSCYEIKSFSPITYHISIHMDHSFVILDIQSSECLLEHEGQPSSDCFSSDGSLFAACWDHIHIWKCTPSGYIQWREFPYQESHYRNTHPLHFSPTLSSILGGFQGVNTLQVWRLDGPPIVTLPNNSMLLVAPHPCVTYIVSFRRGNSTITTTSLLSQTSSHFIDTDMEIEKLALTNHVLLVLDSTTIAAWRLTEEGVVDGLLRSDRGSHHNRIWAIPLSQSNYLEFSVTNQTVFIQENRITIHVYHRETGEVVEPTQPSPPNCGGLHHLDTWCHRWPHTHCHQPHRVSSESMGDWLGLNEAIQQGWVRGPEGKHQLWIPVKWRALDFEGIRWLHNVKTLWFTIQGEPVVIKF